MGVYHLMGLGLSPGAVTGPISYLAELYNNWEAEGKAFFASSGEEQQREKGDPVGGIQLLILFTTKEVIDGEVDCEKYIKNPYGKIGGNLEKRTDTMKKVLEPLVIEEWSKIKPPQIENTGIIYWCEVELRDIKTTYERIAKVVASLAKGSGQQGKEIWMNLTGGNNVINSALQLAASLSGEVARIYYVQAANDTAKRCVHFTDIHNYWVELPVIPLAISDLNYEILNIVDKKQEIKSSEILSNLQGHDKYWSIFQNLELEDFINKHLRPLKKQGLIDVHKRELSDKDGICTLGSQWYLIREYEKIMTEALKKADQEGLTIENLEQHETWISRQEIQLN